MNREGASSCSMAALRDFKLLKHGKDHIILSEIAERNVHHTKCPCIERKRVAHCVGKRNRNQLAKNIGGKLFFK